MTLDIAAIVGRTHVVAALGTADARVAKIKSARLFLSLAAILETMRLRMARAFDIDGNNDSVRLEMLAAGAFALGQDYEARKESLKQEFSVRLGQLITSFRDNVVPTEATPFACDALDGVGSFAAARERIAAPARATFTMSRTATQTAHMLGLDRKTINRYYGLFRAAIHAHQRRQIAALVGIVEYDESYFGQARARGIPGPRKRGRGTNKQPVFGIFERRGAVFTEIVPDVKAKTL